MFKVFFNYQTPVIQPEPDAGIVWDNLYVVRDVETFDINLAEWRVMLDSEGLWIFGDSLVNPGMKTQLLAKIPHTKREVENAESTS